MQSFSVKNLKKKGHHPGENDGKMTMNWHGIHHGSSWSYNHEKPWKAMFLNGTKVFDDCQTYHG